MSEAALKHRSHPTRRARTACGGRPTLQQRLERLTDDLARLRDGSPQDARSGSPPGRWDDEDYIYREVPLATLTELAADICVHKGRVVIRVER